VFDILASSAGVVVVVVLVIAGGLLTWGHSFVNGNGEQAKTYADAHRRASVRDAYGGVYARASAASLADPINTKLQSTVQTIFRGTTLRGLLLEAYVFSAVGTIMLWGAMASFNGAACIAVLVGLGFWHARRTSAGFAG
jgi:hypothetical protein